MQPSIMVGNPSTQSGAGERVCRSRAASSPPGRAPGPDQARPDPPAVGPAGELAGD